MTVDEFSADSAYVMKRCFCQIAQHDNQLLVAAGHARTNCHFSAVWFETAHAQVLSAHAPNSRQLSQQITTIGHASSALSPAYLA